MTAPLSQRELERRRRLIVLADRRGWGNAEIAKRLGVSVCVVSWLRRRFGLLKRVVDGKGRSTNDVRPHTGRPAVPEAEIVALYKEGLPISEICGRLGIAHGTVQRVQRKHGLTRRKIGPTEEAAILADYHAGMTWVAIAKKHGITEGGLLRVLRRTGAVGSWRAALGGDVRRGSRPRKSRQD